MTDWASEEILVNYVEDAEAFGGGGVGITHQLVDTDGRSRGACTPARMHA